jgi:hypothetical protein
MAGMPTGLRPIKDAGFYWEWIQKVSFMFDYTRIPQPQHVCAVCMCTTRVPYACEVCSAVLLCSARGQRAWAVCVCSVRMLCACARGDHHRCACMSLKEEGGLSLNKA